LYNCLIISYSGKIYFNIKIKLNSNLMTTVHHVDVHLDLSHAYKIGTVTLFSAGPFMVEWCCALAAYAAVANSNSAVILIVCGSAFSILGACLGATIGKSWRSLPKTGALGSLLMVPFMFAEWSFASSPPAGGINSFFW
jgi:hypothetical protein